MTGAWSPHLCTTWRHFCRAENSLKICRNKNMTYETLPLRGVKAVILAGGRGSRLSEETDTKPKPMIEIGGRPILWHIMKIYAQYGIEDFIICLGYNGAPIKEYFYNYNLHSSDITVDLRSGVTIHQSEAEDWRVTLVETGLETQTGGRVSRI